MSGLAVAWALDVDLAAAREASLVLNPPSVAVLRVALLCLANQADNLGRGACPSVKTVAEAAGVDRRTAQRALRVLAERDLARPDGVHPTYQTTVHNLQMHR